MSGRNRDALVSVTRRVVDDCVLKMLPKWRGQARLSPLPPRQRSIRL